MTVIVTTAKQSCELLLKVRAIVVCCRSQLFILLQIIDSILDYSKLEASG